MCILTETCRHYAKLHPKMFVNIGHPLSVLLVLVGTAFFFSLQMFYVVPNIFGADSLMNKLGWLAGIFVTYNILGNMLACYLTSSSVESLPKGREFPEPEEEHLWRYCEVCEKLMPPRSWHCALCKCCMLKRDHHCAFTANCIGHNNHRYFFWFIFYLTLGTSLSMVTLLIDGLRKVWLLGPLHSNLKALLLATATQKIEIYGIYGHYLLVLLNALAFGFPALMLAFQIQIMDSNATYYKMFSRLYDLGFRKNCQLILGQRGLWTFVSPWLKSPLPHDGSRWQMKQAA
ncbi:probable palmitoyltransferase ZDHHC24 isoform X1 [Drosophila takahashii]|uniref:probable palmitoyltransferase ZDHHC24 isoform X1 n=1 Tax=Drosophila takahashii TaxID=29030 RepID=UPI001CF83C4F|nr:probable palmitoyltransferase ZDHHC24 isoform X1 [Drosophila takahashii]